VPRKNPKVNTVPKRDTPQSPPTKSQQVTANYPTREHGHRQTMLAPQLLTYTHANLIFYDSHAPLQPLQLTKYTLPSQEPVSANTKPFTVAHATALNTPDDCTSPHRHQRVEQAHLTSLTSPNASLATPQTEQKQFVSHKRLNWSDAIMGYMHLHLLSLHLQKRPLYMNVNRIALSTTPETPKNRNPHSPKHTGRTC
jgi:hypothetical protein